MIRAAAMGALALAIAATPGGARDPERVPHATPVGKPLECISLRSLGPSRVRSDRVIDFITRGGSVYRNTLPRSCPSLGFERAFSYEQQNSARVCADDLIRVIYSADGTRGGGCAIGRFQPVEIARADR